MKESFQNGEVTSAFNAPTIADGIAVKTPGDLTFDIIKELVDDVVVVEEDEIAQAILFMMESQKIVSEGAGAVSTAALLSGKYKPEAGENVVCVVSGGNVDVNTLYRIIGVALAKEGRRVSLKVNMNDKPGNFTKVTSIISEAGANILSANQGSLASGDSLTEQSAEFILETLDIDHIKRVKSAIVEAGFCVKEI